MRFLVWWVLGAGGGVSCLMYGVRPDKIEPERGLSLGFDPQKEDALSESRGDSIASSTSPGGPANRGEPAKLSMLAADVRLLGVPSKRTGLAERTGAA